MSILNVLHSCVIFVIVCVCLSWSVFIQNTVCVLSWTDSFPNSDGVSGQTSRNTDVSRNTPINLGTPEFPAEEGLYYQNVLLAVERWFSLFGWPSGPNPISVPHTLRRYTGEFPQLFCMGICFTFHFMFNYNECFASPHRVVSKIQMNPSTGRTYRVSQNKDSRCVYEIKRCS